MESNQYEHYQPRRQSNIMLPISIIIAGVLVAGAIYIVKKDSQGTSSQTTTPAVEIKVNPVSQADHVLGNPNAPVAMIEFSDTDCPFCQRFHPDLQKLIDKYGKDGHLSWVYRHFAFHERAPKEAEATECAAEVGGNDKFWQFLAKVFSDKHFQTSATDTYQGIDPADLPNVAASIGINKAQFTTCLSSGKYATKVKNQYDEAIDAGAVGTPHTIMLSTKPVSAVTKDFVDKINLQILQRQGPGGTPPFSITPDKKKIIVSGAMQYVIMDQLVQLMIQDNT
jgi:protein-disulfide isomerase